MNKTFKVAKKTYISELEFPTEVKLHFEKNGDKLFVVEMPGYSFPVQTWTLYCMIVAWLEKSKVNRYRVHSEEAIFPPFAKVPTRGLWIEILDKDVYLEWKRTNQRYYLVLKGLYPEYTVEELQ